MLKPGPSIDGLDYKPDRQSCRERSDCQEGARKPARGDDRPDVGKCRRRGSAAERWGSAVQVLCGRRDGPPDRPVKLVPS